MSKYYTPTIEEFHVGFEYYHATFKDQELSKYIVDDSYDFSTLKEEIISEVVRVKYLDREDIESLGGVKIKDVHNGKHPSYDCFSFERPIYEWFVVMFNYTDNWCTIHMENHTEDIRFYGAIKNKSELKKVLKMIGV